MKTHIYAFTMGVAITASFMLGYAMTRIDAGTMIISQAPMQVVDGYDREGLSRLMAEMQ